MNLASTPKPETGAGPGQLTGLRGWPREHRPAHQGRSCDRRRRGTGAARGAQPRAGGRPHQHQDVGHDNVVALRAAGPVGLELEAAVLEEGHRVVAIEGDVAFVPELPVEKSWGSAGSSCVGWQCLPRGGADSRPPRRTAHLQPDSATPSLATPRSTPNPGTSPPPGQAAKFTRHLLRKPIWSSLDVKQKHPPHPLGTPLDTNI